MKRVSKIRLFAYLLLLLAGGCTQADVEEDVIPSHALKDVDARFTLNVLATRTPVTRSLTFTPDGTIESDTPEVGVKDSVQTKAAAALTGDQESEIASLWVAQYDATTGELLYNQYFLSLTSTTVNLKLKQNQAGTRSHVYFIPNAGDLGAIANEATLLKHTLNYASTDAGLPEGNLCKMVGMWDGEVVAGGLNGITVSLTRLLAKITFTYSIGSDFAFTPSSVVLKNAPTKSQIEAPTTQLPDVGYTDYTGIAKREGATIYWYLPENMAGTVAAPDAVESEKNKIGKGVVNATCIELTGEAVQGGVTYTDVTFRFYPGSDQNNYDIIRNSHYTMTVKLVGIDISDERITVGEIPPIEVDQTEMPAKKGGEKTVQITARPGQEWVFDMPLWLSALLNGTEVSPNTEVSWQGPAQVVFKSVEANPTTEKREASFKININGVYQDIKIVQSGSTLIKGNDISLAATSGSEGSSSFTATAGLKWLAALTGDGWLGWSGADPVFSGDEAPEGPQTLNVTTIAPNPLATERSGKITVKAGASVGSDYTGLKQEINVTQAGSTVSSLTKTVAAEAANDLTSSFTVTSGLSWAASVTADSWITLKTTSGGPTTGTENLTYDVAVNPSSSSRTEEITVRAGDISAGPTGKITVTQDGAELSVSEEKTVAATASATDYTSTFSATKGLSWNVSDNMDWLTLTGTTSGTNNTTGTNQDITYSVVVNPNESSRNGNITVKAGNISKEVTIRQAGSVFDVTGGTEIIAASGGTTTGSVTATDGLAWTISPATDNGITVKPTNGSGNTQLEFSANENKIAERAGTFVVTVTDSDPLRTATVTATQAMGNVSVCIDNLQIQKSDPGIIAFADVTSFCEDLNEENHDDWRLPTKDELLFIYENQASLETYVEAGFVMLNDGGKANKWFWSSEFSGSNRWVVNMITGRTTSSSTPSGGGYIRCVRDYR